MIADIQKFKPIKTFGIFVSFLGIAGSFVCFLELDNPEFVTSFRIFIISIVLWHLLTGLGILLRKSWGFYLLKFYLNILILAYPIGTVTAKKMFKYMEENQIKDLFFAKGILL